MSADQSSPGDTSSRKGSKPIAGLEFFKVVLIAGIVGLGLAGYSHVDTVYNRFGLALHEVGLDYLETLEFTVFMLRQPVVLFSSIGVILVFAASAASISYSFGNFGFYVSLAILLLLLSFFAGYVGSLTGNAYADNIINDKGGRHTYCVLKENTGLDNEIMADFQQMTTDNRVRMIKHSEGMIYLYIIPLPTTVEPDKQGGNRHGDHMLIPMDAVSFCRVSSGVRRDQ